ncbi:HD domain-containing protein [Patescibacteria group bacterium]|nr:MAG: HD domain-containing protein [Patescibacteria group bacterium]
MDNGIEFKKFCFKMKWERRLEKKFSKFPLEVKERYAEEFDHYLKSNDHGLPHAANVYGKVLEILDRFSVEEIREMDIDIERLEAMCIFHDAGRFLVPVESAPNYAKRKRKGQILHEYAGALLAEIFGYNHPIIREGILRHDYFSQDFDPGKKPPVSIEAQIIRAADKTSVDPADEIERYDEYRRKFKFPLFNRDTPTEFRLDWNFSFKRDSRTDQLCYFFAVLALRPENFIHPVLQEYYRDWSQQKKEAVDKILEIVRKDQGDGAADIVDCQIAAYLKARGISF